MAITRKGINFKTSPSGMLVPTTADNAGLGAIDVYYELGMTYGTSFPASPADKAEHVLVDNATTPTFQWRFRYHSSSSNTNKWEFVGGSPLMVSWDAGITGPASTTYASLSTAQKVTIPAAGVYEIDFGANAWAQLAAIVPIWLTVKLGTAAASDTDGIRGWVGNAANNVYAMSRAMIRTGLSASAVIELMGRLTTVSGSAQPNYENGWLRVRPIRCS